MCRALSGAMKSKAAELVRRDLARKRQALAISGRWLKAHAALMEQDEAQAGVCGGCAGDDFE